MRPRAQSAAAAGAASPLEEIVARLRDAGQGLEEAQGRRRLPGREAMVEITAALRAALFPAHFGASDLSDRGLDAFVAATLGAALSGLEEQVGHALRFARGRGDGPAWSEARAGEVVGALAAELPRLREQLGTDVRAAFEGDPAATSLDEAVFCYPGVTAITHHRLAHALHALGVPLLPRMIAEISHSETGIDIHPAAVIGSSFFIDHGTGVVIGETSIIGARVRLYQGVTLGARSFPLDERGVPRKGVQRHPIIEDDVVIYAGATILGRVRIGRGSTIGGNVWLTRSVPPGSRITQAQVQSESFENGSGI
jgi:serine O-acetyltransferase